MGYDLHHHGRDDRAIHGAEVPTDLETLEQRLMLDGVVPYGPQLPVTGPSGSAMDSAVAMDADGQFRVIWGDSDNYGTYQAGVFERLFGWSDGIDDPVHQLVGPVEDTGYHDGLSGLDLAADGDGDFVVVWTEASHGYDPSGLDIMAQRFDASGTALTPAFTVGEGQDAAVAMADTGEFVVAWSAYDDDPAGVRARFYDAEGTPTSAELQLMDRSVEGVSVAMANDGDLVLGWTELGSYGSDATMYYRMFDAAGVPTIADQVLGSFDSTDTVPAPLVAADAVGNALVVWPGGGDGMGGATKVYGRFVDAAGRSVLPPVVLVSEPGAGVSDVDVAMDAAGGFVVSWNSYDAYAMSTRLVAQRFEPTGVEAGPRLEIAGRNVGDAEVALDADGDLVAIWGRGMYNAGVNVRFFDAADNPTGPTGRLIHESTSIGMSYPAVAADADGDFVATWRQYDANTMRHAVWAQRFAADGSPHGARFLVGVPDGYSYLNATPAVAVDADGDFLIVWDNGYNSMYGTYDSIVGRFFDADGYALGEEVTFAGDRAEMTVSTPAVAMDDAGNFVVAWSAYDGPTANGSLIAQRFDATGMPVGDPIEVAEAYMTTLPAPAVGMDADGDFLVARPVGDAMDGVSQVVGHFYDAAGAAVGEPVMLVDHDGMDNVAVAMDAAGAFILTWSDGDPYGGTYDDDDGPGIIAQRFDATGQAAGPLLAVSDDYGHPAVGMDADGDAVIVWTESYAHELMARALPAGDFRGLMGLQTNMIHGAASDARVAMDADGDYVMVWSRYDMMYGTDVWAQLFDADGTPRGEPLEIATMSGEDSYALAMDADGDFMIVTAMAIDPGNPDSTDVIQALFFDAAGTLVDQRMPLITPGTAVDDVAVATDDQGGYVVAWSAPAGAYDGGTLYGQRFNAAGPVGWTFEVASSSDLTGDVAVAMDATGDATVIWATGSYAGDATIMARQYPAAGQAGAAGAIAMTDSQVLDTAIAMDATGNAVVTWNQYADDTEANVWARRFTDTMSPAGPILSVGSTGAVGVSAAMDADGDFLITSTEGDPGMMTYGGDVLAHRFSAAGAVVGTSILLGGPRSVGRADIAATPDGGFILTGIAPGDDPGAGSDSYELLAQRYTALGTPIGPVIQVAPAVAGQAVDSPAVAVDDDGDFVIVWQSGTGEYYGGELITARLFNADGSARGMAFQLAGGDGMEVSDPRVEMDADGDFIVLWDQYAYMGGGSAMQRFDAQGSPLGPAIGSDTVYAMAVTSDGGLMTLTAGNIDTLQARWYDPLGNPAGWAPLGRFIGEAWNTEVQLALDPDGNFAVLQYARDMYYEDATAPVLQRYDAQGRPTQAPVVLDDVVADYDTFRIAMDTDGDLIVLGSDDPDGDSYGDDGGDGIIPIYVYPAAGADVDPAFRLGAMPVAARTTNVAAAADADGDHVVVWQDYDMAAMGGVVLAQRFTAAGLPVGPTLEVAWADSMGSPDPAVAMDADGDFAVFWRDYDGYAMTSSLQGRFYTADGQVGDPVELVPHETDTQVSSPAAAMDANGNFVLAWAQWDEMAMGPVSVMAGIFDAGGAASGQAFGVAEIDDASMTGVDVGVGMDADGDFIVLWQGGYDPSGMYLQEGYGTLYDAVGGVAEAEIPLTPPAASAPSVAMDANGDFAVAWSEYDGDDMAWNLVVQKFDGPGPDAVPGDADLDGDVDLDDFAILKVSFGQNPLTDGRADFDRDGDVDLDDFALLKNNFGTAAPAPVEGSVDLRTSADATPAARRMDALAATVHRRRRRRGTERRLRPRSRPAVDVVDALATSPLLRS